MWSSMTPASRNLGSSWSRRARRPSCPPPRSLLSTASACHIELTFRDWKTHLGVRGWRLEVDPALRLGRLLLALSSAYILAVRLGSGPLATTVRTYCEVLRSRPRHGTRHRLSALSIGILALSLARFTDLVHRELGRILTALQRGQPATEIFS